MKESSFDETGEDLSDEKRYKRVSTDNYTSIYQSIYCPNAFYIQNESNQFVVFGEQKAKATYELIKKFDDDNTRDIIDFMSLWLDNDWGNNCS